MRGLKIGLSAVAMVAAVFLMTGYSLQVWAAGPPQSSAATPASPDYVPWPLPAADRAYGAIDGKHLLQYVAEVTAISRRYRDQGHQYWGRIIGTSSDAETAQWLLDKFKQIGMVDTKIQPIDLTSRFRSF